MVLVPFARRLVVSALVLIVAWPTPVLAQLLEPVDGDVVDRFRPPAHIGAPGNRGWEYETNDGSAVIAASGGVVVFAGQIGPSLYVSVQHPDGLRTTYAHLAEVVVVRGERVVAGSRLGTTGSVFHFGARRDGTYVDPAGLFVTSAGTMRVRLVSPRLVRANRDIAVAWPMEGSGLRVRLTEVPQYTRRSAHQRVN